jgi:Aerotolerance regulator N-terminal
VTFLQPLLLSLAVLIGVPFIIHLFGERKYKPILFSSLKFLREIERDSLQKLQLRQWLVLLSRALWIAMLIIALAQPFFESSGGSIESGIFIIDKSFSTRIDGDYHVKTLRLTGNYPKWAIVEYDEHDHEDSLRAMVIKQIDRSKEKSQGIVFISDFQENQQNRDVINTLQSLSDKIYVLAINKTAENFAISKLRLLPSSLQQNMKSLEVLVSKNDPNSMIPIVYVNMEGKQSGRVSLNETGSGYFHFSNSENRQIPCVVKCSDDAYPEDNSRYLVIKNYPQIKILCVNKADEINYHLNALRAMDELIIKEISPDQLVSENFEEYDMMWFSNLYSLSSNMLKLVQAYGREHPVLITAGREIPQQNMWNEITGQLIAADRNNSYVLAKIPLAEGDAENLRIKQFYTSTKMTNNVLWTLGTGDPLLAKLEDNIYFLFSPFHFDWNEIGLSPYFTRYISEFINEALGVEERVYLTGESIPVQVPFSTVITPGGEKHQVKDRFMETETPGFYTIENPENKYLLAVNIPEEEMIQTNIDVSKMKVLKWDGETDDEIDKQIKGRQAQTLFYILAAVFIILEMLLLRKGESTT